MFRYTSKKDFFAAATVNRVPSGELTAISDTASIDGDDESAENDSTSSKFNRNETSGNLYSGIDDDSDCLATHRTKEDEDPLVHETSKVTHYGQLGKHFVKRENLNIGTKHHRNLLSQPIRAMRRASQDSSAVAIRFSQKVFLKAARVPMKPLSSNKPTKPIILSKV